MHGMFAVMLFSGRPGRAARIACLSALVWLAGAVLAPPVPAVGATAGAVSGVVSPPTLRRQVVTDGDSLRLGDFFADAGPHSETVVAYAPAPGRRAVFDAQWLARIARRYRLDWRPAGRHDRVIVERRSTIIEAGDILAALTARLRARDPDGAWEIVLARPSLRLHLPAGQPARIEVLDLALTGDRLTARLAIPGDRPDARPVTVQARLYPTVHLPVPARALHPGHVVRPADLVRVPVRQSRLHSQVLADAQAIVGQTARLALRAGQPIRRTDVYTPPLVRKGARVRMGLVSGNLHLMTAGQAIGAGSRGDRIAVRNLRSGLVVEATVTGPDQVTVPVPAGVAIRRP